MKQINLRLERLQQISVIAGTFFLVLSGIGLAVEKHEFFIAWLFAFVFWISLSLGCLLVAMIHYLTGGCWGNPTRRFFEAGYMTLPLMALFFIPILFGLPELYPWARPAQVANDTILQQKVSYENALAFFSRAVFFFSAWILLAAYLRKWSLQQDDTPHTERITGMRALSGPGIVIVPFTITFAFIDWVMSMEPAWFSTVFGVILLAGQVLVAFAFATILLAWLRRVAPFQNVVEMENFHSLGNLLLTFVMFWTYVTFSQLLIIYSGNQPHEIDWYLHRIAGDWKWLVGAIALFHFFAPFLLLLFRANSQSATRLTVIAGLIFFTFILEVFWLIVPTFYPAIRLHWTDFTAWAGIGGIWLGVFARNLKRHPLLARNDPRMENSAIQSAHAE
ncbi:MAG TPA: hypothetical protein VGI03_14155 [Verrucomicrobiae bacterium]|jgi:hypothetical protein